MNASDPAQLPVVDEAALEELREIMEDEFADLVETFLQDMPLQVQAVAEAVTDQNADEVYRRAHKLKSGSGSIGAPRLAEWARQVESRGREGQLGDIEPLVARLQAVAQDTESALRNLLTS